MANSVMTTSVAPAGKIYRDVEHAGECILADNAENFPDTDESSMIPPIFKTKYPEPIDETTGAVLQTSRILTEKEEDRFTGMTRNVSGEEAEYVVFKEFERLVSRKNSPTILVIRNYELTQNPSQNFRTAVLMSELGIDFSTLHTKGEFDAVVAVRDVGLVLCEVKTQFTEKQHNKAEEQLQHGKLFFQHVMSHIAVSSCQLPVVKIIIFPGEKLPSPRTKSSNDSYIIYQDMMPNFVQKWNEAIVELQALRANNFFSSDDFRRFIRIITGVWCMEPYKKRDYRFINDEASQACLVQHNDDMINRGILSSDVRVTKTDSKIVTPVADLELCRPQGGYPKCRGMDLIYLTPGQKNLYKNVPQAILRGLAGSGKTIVSKLKIVNILQNHTNKNVLIIAPPPHHLRLEQFVKLNGGHATVSQTFPPPVSGGVVIMTLKNFFKVSPQTLESYDVSGYHVFIDDLQSLFLDGTETATFDHVVNFIEQAYAALREGNQIFWCAVDEGQSRYLNVDSRRVTNLFNTDKTTPRQLTIPVYILEKVLRNSVEISAVAKKVRSMRIARVKATSVVLGNQTTGHCIRSQAVSYHKLSKWTGDTEYGSEGWKKYGTGFVVERVREEVKSLLAPKNYMMNMSEIAIFYDYEHVLRPITDMLLFTFNTTPQTIEQYITTNNNSIIIDTVGNIASFECACVVYVNSFNAPGGCDNYNIMTRGRTKLVVVDYGDNPPILTTDVILTTWEEQNGNYEKV